MPLSPAAPSASGEAHRAAHRSVGPAVAMLRGAGLTRNTTGGAPAAALRSAAAGGVAVRAPSRREGIRSNRFDWVRGKIVGSCALQNENKKEIY